MTAISRSKVSIYIKAAGTNLASLTSTDMIEGEIKEYSKSGGEEDVESDPVFGGFVDKEKPVTQVEIALTIIPKINADQDRWDAFTYALDSQGVYTMASETSTQPSNRTICIEAVDGTNYKTWGFNNAKVTSFDFSHNADDNQEGNLVFKFSPTDDSGVSNFMTLATAKSNMPNWTALDNNNN